MFNETDISAAMVMVGSPDQGTHKRGTIVLFQLFGATFFADEVQQQWPSNNARRLQAFEVQQRIHEVLPIDLPVDITQVPQTFDYGSFQFMVIKPGSPFDEPQSGALAAAYKVKGMDVRDYVSLETLHASTLHNIMMRMIGLAPGKYSAEFMDLLNKMTRIGDARARLFPT